MRLLARVQEAAARGGEPLVDLGRGNPDVPPPPHVIEALVESAREQTAIVHGYAPFSGLPELRRSLARRYATLYGVELDPEREVAVVPGTKSALAELILCLAEQGDTVLLPDPYYPDYPSGIALAGADLGLLTLDPERGYAPRFDLAPRERVAAVFLNYPSNPTPQCVPRRRLRRRGRVRARDRRDDHPRLRVRRPRLRRPRAAELLAEPGAREVGVELFSMSKSYGMAGWRLGFVAGNAESSRASGAAGSPARRDLRRGAARRHRGARRAAGHRRGARRAVRGAAATASLAAVGELAAPCEGTFYVWIRLPRADAERLLGSTGSWSRRARASARPARGWARLSSRRRTS